MLWRKGYRRKTEKELQEKWKGLSLEKGDLPAMLIAAMLTLLPAIILVGGGFLLAIWALFLR